jgi:hypothetical protein
MEWFAAPELEQARWLLQRALALVYLLAFVTIVDQWRGLLGGRRRQLLANHYGTIAAYRLGE